MTAKIRRPRPDRRVAPPRQPRNGHDPDCPFPERDVEFCGVCAGIRKGRDVP